MTRVRSSNLCGKLSDRRDSVPNMTSKTLVPDLKFNNLIAISEATKVVYCVSVTADVIVSQHWSNWQLRPRGALYRLRHTFLLPLGFHIPPHDLYKAAFVFTLLASCAPFLLEGSNIENMNLRLDKSSSGTHSAR
ncbi:hypothetical protein ABKN59_004363 [Abortiporus biennis]